MQFFPNIRVSLLWLATKINKSGSVIYYPICKLELLIRHAYINKTGKDLIRKEKYVRTIWMQFQEVYVQTVLWSQHTPGLMRKASISELNNVNNFVKQLTCLQNLSVFPAAKIAVPTILCLMTFSLNLPSHFFCVRIWVWFHQVHSMAGFYLHTCFVSG